MGYLTAGDVVAWLERYRTVVAEEAPRLTALDAAIGDADHGTNLDRGLRAVGERVLGQAAGKDAGWVLEQTGMTLLSTVGGAGGPLYGTLFMSMGRAAAGRPQLDAREFAGALQAGVEGLARRGKARAGEKTMLDALIPALAALDARLDSGGDLRDGVAAAAAAAEDGCRATIPMRATKGRASYLGERSAGHQDPGATSSALLLRALLDTLNAR
ncbi:MAG: dihydroxyacetone kinase subunit DhaL [Candidatus Dormibacteraceae bacterium]